jgi:cytochrome bd-type quinol oxidase subunit 2
MEVRNFIYGVLGIVLFIILIISFWDYIQIEVSELAGSYGSSWYMLVVTLIPFAIIIAGIIGIYRLFKGRFGR